jgi:polar amino acid transport system permease protein
VAVPQRHWGRKVAAVVVLLVLAAVALTFASSKNVHWSEIPHYLWSRPILDGVVLTLELTFITMIGGVVVGTLGALMRLSQNRVLRAVSWAYIWLFRGTPLLVQIVFIFNLALFVPTLGFGDFKVSTNAVITTFVAAIVSLTLNCGANMTEIVRGGFLSVDRGQVEAATALGLSHRTTVSRIVLPQALRVIVPASGNELILQLKNTSLVSVIGAQELLTQAQIIYQQNYLVVELLIVASVWYLLMTTIATLAQQRLEAWLSVSVNGGSRGRGRPHPEASSTEV